MATLSRPTTLLGWMRRWCERPGMYLVGAPDYTNVNVSILRTWIFGYDLALEDLGRPSEHSPFRAWVHERRPDLQEHPLWYGEAILPEMGGDHERVVSQIRRWVDEYEFQLKGT